MADRWIKRWYIEGTKGDTYTVALDETGAYGCSCPAWKFRRQECRHIKEVRIQLLQKENSELKETVLSIPASKPAMGNPCRIVKFEERAPRKFAFEDC